MNIIWYCAALVFACWIALVVVWITAWLHDRRRSVQVRERAPFPTGLVILMLAYVAAAVLVPPAFWKRLAFQPSPAAQYVGMLLVVLSTAFTIWARLALGTMWSLLASGRVGHQLRTSGPYAVTRHPIYTGILGMMVGTTIVVGGGICFVASLTVILAFLIKARSEEELLMRIFGEEYRAYQHRVPGIIPLPKLRAR